MAFNPAFSTPLGDSFIGSLAWTEDAAPTNTGFAYVFRASGGDHYYVDHLDETGSKMDEALFTFSEVQGSGFYKETYRLNANVLGAATPWIMPNVPNVPAVNGVVGNAVIIVGPYHSVHVKALSSGGDIIIGDVNDGLGYVIGGAGWDSIEADGDELVYGDQEFTARNNAIVEITVVRKV